MIHLYYCRHGESEANSQFLWGGHTDSSLTEKGKSQAHAAGDGLKAEGTKIDLIICSPLIRAHETAKIIAESIGYPVEDIICDQRFIERSFGSFDGKPNTVEWLKTHQYQELDDVEGSEKIKDLQERAAAGLEYLKTLPAENILLVGHGAFGRGLVRTIKGRPYTDEFKVDGTTIMNVIPNAKVIQLI